MTTAAHDAVLEDINAGDSGRLVRPASQNDQSRVFDIAFDLVKTADTYAFDPSISEPDMWAYWVPSPPKGQGYVIEWQDKVAGLFVIKQNQPGPGSHVANASFAVDKTIRGAGLGRAMGEAAIALAPTLGFTHMQFNIVLASNTGALALWRSLGFNDIGLVPEGFRRPNGDYDDFYIMHRKL